MRDTYICFLVKLQKRRSIPHSGLYSDYNMMMNLTEHKDQKEGEAASVALSTGKGYFLARNSGFLDDTLRTHW